MLWKFGIGIFFVSGVSIGIWRINIVGWVGNGFIRGGYVGYWGIVSGRCRVINWSYGVCSRSVLKCFWFIFVYSVYIWVFMYV